MSPIPSRISRPAAAVWVLNRGPRSKWGSSISSAGTAAITPTDTKCGSPPHGVSNNQAKTNTLMPSRGQLNRRRLVYEFYAAGQQRLEKPTGLVPFGIGIQCDDQMIGDFAIFRLQDVGTVEQCQCPCRILLLKFEP